MKFYVIGDVTVDHLYHLEHLPTPGADISPRRSTMQPGGAGGTISVTLARLGHSVTLAARVGDDPFAEYALAQVRESGVSESAIQRDADHLTSTITVMQTPGGERAMISDGAANRQLDPAKLKKKDIEGADALIISAYSLTEGRSATTRSRPLKPPRPPKSPYPSLLIWAAARSTRLAPSWCKTWWAQIT